MNNNLLQLKIKNRLNKLASFDYDNIECWLIAEAFNKAQNEWTRTQVQGNNIRKEGEDATKMSIDDLQRILVAKVLTGTQKDNVFRTESIPEEYFYFDKVSVTATSECCKNDASMKVYLAKLADVDILLQDEFTKPSFDWRETFCTINNNRLSVYTDGFEIQDCTLYFYRKPAQVQFEGCIDITTGLAGKNVECMYKDDITDIIIDRAAAILAGDISDQFQAQRNKLNAQETT